MLQDRINTYVKEVMTMRGTIVLFLAVLLLVSGCVHQRSHPSSPPMGNTLDKGKPIGKSEPLERGIPEGLQKIQSTWTEQQKYAFDLGRADSLGRVDATISRITGKKIQSRASREETEEVFISYNGFPEKLEQLHQIYEWSYADFLNPNKVVVPRGLETTLSNLSLFAYDLGLAYELGVVNALLEKPESPRSEREDKQYPFIHYKDDSKGLEQLHRAFEWGYIHGKERLLGG